MTFHYLCFLCVMSLLQEPFMVEHISNSPSASWIMKPVSCELKTRYSYSSAIQKLCGFTLDIYIIPFEENMVKYLRLVQPQLQRY